MEPVANVNVAHNPPSIDASDSLIKRAIKSSLFLAPATIAGLAADFSLGRDFHYRFEKFFGFSASAACSATVLLSNLAFPEITYYPLFEATNVYAAVVGSLGAFGYGLLFEGNIDTLPKKAVGGWCIGLGMNYLCPPILPLILGSSEYSYDVSGPLSKAVGTLVVAIGFSNISAPTELSRKLFGGTILCISASMLFPKSFRRMFY